MKKSVILTLFLVYFASIFIVGFYGAKTRVYDETKKVESIVCVSPFYYTNDRNANIDIQNIDENDKTLAPYLGLKNQNGDKRVDYYFIREFTAEELEKGAMLVLRFDVVPHDATENRIDYGNVENDAQKSGYGFTDNNDGTVTFTFTDEEYCVLKLEPMDKSSSAWIRIYIRIYKKEEI